jgi:hypothetical protein
MRPIPAPRIGESHGLLRAISQRDRVRLDEFVTEFPADELFPPGLENAMGRTRQFVSYARSAGLLKEDRGVVELTEIGKRYVRAGDADAPFEVSEAQADWLRRQLLEKHMTDSIFHGLAIGLSLLSSVPPGTRISYLDFGRSLGYLGRAGWDNDNTLQSQGERYIALMQDMRMLDQERALTQTGHETKAELTLPVHMSMFDIAANLNPGGREAVQAQGEAEWAELQAAAAPEPEPEPEPEAEPEPAARTSGRPPSPPTRRAPTRPSAPPRRTRRPSRPPRPPSPPHRPTSTNTSPRPASPPCRPPPRRRPSPQRRPSPPRHLSRSLLPHPPPRRRPNRRPSRPSPGRGRRMRRR